MAITTNTGAKKIEGNENWRNIFDIHNDSVDAYDARIAELQEGLAIIVDGDTAAVAVPAGSYAFLKNNTHGLANGLYKNTSGNAFPVTGGTADSSVFTAEPDGGLNALNSKITSLLPGVIEIRKINIDSVSGSTVVVPYPSAAYVPSNCVILSAMISQSYSIKNMIWSDSYTIEQNLSGISISGDINGKRLVLVVALFDSTW